MTKDKEILNTALKGLLKRLEKTEKFVIEQAPDICKQMIYIKTLDKKIELITNSWTFVVVLIVTIVLGMKSYSASQLVENGNISGMGLIAGLIGLGTGIWALSLIDSVIDAISWLIYLKKCPKLFLLREFRDLTKGE